MRKMTLIFAILCAIGASAFPIVDTWFLDGAAAATTSRWTGIVAYYKLESGSTNVTVDSTTNNHTLGTSGSYLTSTGIINDCLSNSSTSYVFFDTDSNTFSFTTNFSINLWVNPSASTSDKFIASNAIDPSHQSWGIKAFTSDGGASSHVQVYIDSITTNYLQSSSNLSSGSWSMISVVYDGTQTGNANRLKLYFNGVQDVGVSYFSTIPASISLYGSGGTRQRMVIGGQWTLIGGPVKNNFLGKLDEAVFFTNSLAATNISFLYNGGAPTSAQQYPN